MMVLLAIIIEHEICFPLQALILFRRNNKRCMSLPQHLALLGDYVSMQRLLGHRKMKN